MQPIKATNIRWRVLFITLFLGYIAYVFRGNLSVIGKYLMDDYGVTQIELGWLLSSFLWGYTLFQFPGGLLSEKIGPKSTLIVCTVGCTLITIISGFIVLGGFSIALLTDDESSGISPENEYTHTISGGGVETVNGVDFEL